MKVIFRCDSSFSIGHGHLIRCLNLAKKLEVTPIFLCRTLPENVNSKVLDFQFKLHEFDKESEDLDFIHKEKPDLLIVDSYNIDIEWEKLAKESCKKLVVIDDLKREHFCDAVLDQNYRLDYTNIYNAPRTFLGPKYSLLNKSFKDITHSPLDEKRIMIFFGGSDPANMTLKLTQFLKKSKTEFKFDLVAGSTNSDLKELKAIAKGDSRFKLHIDIDCMAKLMSESTLFVGAGGSTTWERASIGLPSIVISIAENQEEIAEHLHHSGGINYLGRHKDLTMEEILNEIDFLLNDSKRYNSLKNNSLELKVSHGLEELINYLKS